MVLQSGIPPYEYATRVRRFESKPIPIGISGILLEQAQFVITAEIRKWTGVWDDLSNFNVYTNVNITPSGPYEPKPLGTTLDNLLNPGAAVFVDNIAESRLALNTLLVLYSNDTDFNGAYDYRKGWLQSLFPESTSGFISGFDEQVFISTVGHWRHRLPSETGIIDYNYDEVLGSSGVLYDIDFGEVMFNPAPHIARFTLNDIHNTRINNTADEFLIQQSPIFPAFQKTDGSIIDLTGREPLILSTNVQYGIDHVSSGCVRIFGYMFRPLTQFTLSKSSLFGNTSDFTFFSEGVRSPVLPSVPTTAAFLSPLSQTSGVYRIAARNKFSDFPNTSIESGIFSHWPKTEIYWPSDHPTNATSNDQNAGYHVFNDCLWMTDRASTATTGGPFFGYPSGLSILSPFTGHRMWVRYADQTPTTVTTSPSVTQNFNWSTGVGLERLTTDTIVRLMPSVHRTTSNVSGQLIFTTYNDMLDRLSSTTTTSASPNGDNQFPIGGNTSLLHDYWFDGSNYFVCNNVALGFDMWKFNSAFNYTTKYVFNRPSGIHQARGAFINSTNVLFHGFLSGGLTNFAQSGIFPINFITDGTDPFDDSANQPFVGEAEISFGTVKYINGQSILGVAQSAEIMDLFQVTSSTHVIPGVYAIVRFKLDTSPFNAGDFYLLRIVETSSSWEIAALTQLETQVIASVVRRELMYMSY